MDLLLGTGVALLLTLVGYVHYRIPFHTAGASRVLLTRGVLALVGLALGAVMALSYGADYPRAAGFPRGIRRGALPRRGHPVRETRARLGQDLNRLPLPWRPCPAPITTYPSSA